MTKIIPVLDLLNQNVVRGVAGHRDQYQPIQSQLVRGSDPLTVANAIRDQYALNEIYVADLDAIQFQNNDFSTIRKLIEDGFELMVDSGLRNTDQLKKLLDLGTRKLVAGLESIPGPEFLSDAISLTGVDKLIFSLDLMEKKPLSAWDDWKHVPPLQIAEDCLERGIQSFIVLDLKQVGSGEGLETLELSKQIKELHPEIQVTTGGGIRSVGDIEAAESFGMDGLLVSSAIHNGQLDDYLKSKSQ